MELIRPSRSHARDHLPARCCSAEDARAGTSSCSAYWTLVLMRDAAKLRDAHTRRQGEQAAVTASPQLEGHRWR
jgi:hypothetical protein